MHRFTTSRSRLSRLLGGGNSDAPIPTDSNTDDSPSHDGPGATPELPAYSSRRASVRVPDAPTSAELPGYAALFPRSGTAVSSTRRGFQQEPASEAVSGTRGGAGQGDRYVPLNQTSTSPPSGVSSLPSSPPYTTLARFSPFTDSSHPSFAAPTYHSSSSSSPLAPTTRASTQHVVHQEGVLHYNLTTSNGHQWLKVKINSEASSPSKPPMTMEKPLAGELILELLKEEKLKSVFITITGVLNYVQSEPLKFFTQSQTLWDSTMGDPRSPTAASLQPSTSPQQQQQAVKFHGTYTYPFSIQIPRQSTLSPNLSTSNLKELQLPVSRSAESVLPPAFDGRPWHISVEYYMAFRVKKGGAFNADAKLKFPIDYCPPSAPEQPPLARQISYKENRSFRAIGRELDPECWDVMPMKEVSGVAFRKRQVTVQCTLYFARPLAYARGSFVPLALTLRSSDEQTLDILSTSELPIVHLNRTLVSGEDLQSMRPFFINHDMPSVLVVDRRPPIAKVVWRRPDTSQETDNVQFEEGPSGSQPSARARTYERMLYGEIPLPNDLAPTFSFGKFKLVYTADMRPPYAPGFIPSDDSVLSQTEIVIHPCLPDGPRPRSGL